MFAVLHLEELTWPELDALDRAKTIVFIAVSPMEEHGPHLPIGTDWYTAQHFTDTLARAMEAARPDVVTLLMPPVPLGAGTMPLRGSVNVTVDLVFDVARQIGAAFARDGFHTIVFTNGHLSAWHMIALENAALWVSRRFGVQCIAPSASIVRAVLQRGDIATAIGDRLTPAEIAELQRGAHGGMLETSLMLHLHPQLVRDVFATLPPLSRRDMVRHWRGRTPKSWQGYVGAPAQGHAEWGAIAAAAFAQAGAELLLRVLDDGKRGARAARFFPRLPFWLAARRAVILGGAAVAGVGATLLATQVRRGHGTRSRLSCNEPTI
jgi:creatinine amidohydrolase